jgi:hypothetical protein
MSKTIFRVLAIPFSVLILSALITSCNAKVKDADIKASIDKAYATNPDLSMVMVGVNDGTATLTGEVKDANAKSEAERAAKDVKGVTAVVNNLTIFSPPPQVVITPDDPLKVSVDNVIKDFAGVSASINDGVVTLTGEIKKVDLQKLMMALNSLKPKKVDNSKLVIK